MAHQARDGRMAAPLAREIVTEADVRRERDAEIYRELIRGTKTRKQLCLKYNLGRTTLWEIVRRAPKGVRDKIPPGRSYARAPS